MNFITTIKSIENNRFIIALYEGADSLYYVGWSTIHATHIGMGFRDCQTACHIFDMKLTELEMN